MLAENEEGMAGLITGIEKFLGRKQLRFNTDKRKVMRLRKEGEVKKKWSASGKGVQIEEIRKAAG